MSGDRRGITLALVALVAGCTTDPIYLGPDPDFVWWTDHESGDLSDWERHGTHWTNGGGELEIVGDPARSGNHAVRATVVPSPSGTLSAAILVVEDVPATAYSSAWFYVFEPVATADFWVFFKLGARTDAEDAQTEVEVWDFNREPRGAGLGIRAVPRLGQTIDALTAHEIAVGRWFHVEAYLRASDSDDGELRLWLDEMLVLNYDGPTSPSNYVTWTVGGATEGLASGTAALVIDDAAVTTRRLGRAFPPFWRP